MHFFQFPNHYPECQALIYRLMSVNDRNGHDNIGIANIDFDSICVIQHTKIILSNIVLHGSTGGEVHNGVNGFLTSYATDFVRLSQQILLDKEHAGTTTELIR